MVNLAYISEFHKISKVDLTKYYIYNLSEFICCNSFASVAYCMDKSFMDKIYICMQGQSSKWSKSKYKDYLIKY